MKREEAVGAMEAKGHVWDVIVIGGGATGLGVAVDASARGYKTLLLEQSDFAKATSSRSTKLIHGGVRYLRQGRLSLVSDSLKERGRLVRNAPGLVQPLPFIVPTYHWHEIPYYLAGLKLYDLFAGRWRMDPSRRLNRQATLEQLPNLVSSRLKGGIQYYDAQFDDAQLAMALAETIFRLGGKAVNYAQVRELLKEGSRVDGVIAEDLESGKVSTIRGRAIINATGVFADAIRRLDHSDAPPIMTYSRGSHIVLPASFLSSKAALMVPKTSDGRVLFAIPWQGRLLAGTTDVPTTEASLDPSPSTEEIAYILGHLRDYLRRTPEPHDILSCFAGLRPLVKAGGAGQTSKISRDHSIEVSLSGLITVAGGKWTTYRKMGADTIDRAIETGRLKKRQCVTEKLAISSPGPDGPNRNSNNDDEDEDQPVSSEQPEAERRLHPSLPFSEAEVVSAVRHQMARTVEDVLARRLRALFLDVEASVEIAPKVAAIVAKELGRTDDWAQRQVVQYKRLAGKALPQTAEA